MQLKETPNRLCHANLQTLGKNTKGQKQQRAQYKSRAALASFQPKASWPKKCANCAYVAQQHDGVPCPTLRRAHLPCQTERHSLDLDRIWDNWKSWAETGMPVRANIGHPSVPPSCEIDPCACAAQNFYLFLRWLGGGGRRAVAVCHLGYRGIKNWYVEICNMAENNKRK